MTLLAWLGVLVLRQLGSAVYAMGGAQLALILWSAELRLRVWITRRST